MRSWRKMTWAILIWTAVMGFWIVGGGSAASQTPAASDAEAVGVAIGTGIGVTLLFMLWFIGFIILSIIWFMTKPKSSMVVYGPQGQQMTVTEKEAAKRVKNGWSYQQGTTPAAPPVSPPPAPEG